MMFADPLLPIVALRVLRAGMAVITFSKTTVTTTTKTKGG